VQHGDESPLLVIAHGLRPCVASIGRLVALEGEYPHVALPDALALEILFYMDLLDEDRLAAVKPANRLLELRDGDFGHAL
jgi:hypothetical protein